MPSVISPELLLDILELIHRAGLEILKIYNDLEGRWKVGLKEDLTPITEADRVSNTIITGGLRRFFPDIPVISEENLKLPYEIRRNYEYCWVLDPLDGTKEFLKRNGEFTVNLALIHRGHPVAGFISVPCQGLYYYALKGEGAFRFEWMFGQESQAESAEAMSYKEQLIISLEKKVRLKAAEFSLDDPGLAVVASRSHFDEETRKFIESLNQPRLINRGSSLKFMMLAEGRAHLYPRLARTMEWDTAAGQAILEEAGGQVLEFYTRSALIYNKELLVNPPFLAVGNLII